MLAAQKFVVGELAHAHQVVGGHGQVAHLFRHSQFVAARQRHPEQFGRHALLRHQQHFAPDRVHGGGLAVARAVGPAEAHCPRQAGGLAEVAELTKSAFAGLTPDEMGTHYAENGWIYISYAQNFADSTAATTILRFKLDGNTAVNQEELIVAGPAWKGGRHFGSRIVFDKAGFLYFSNGDKGNIPMNAQNLNNAHGKIHRIKDDGGIPADNPFKDSLGNTSSIWTYGNRNPQGLIYDKANDRIWEVEHGPMGGDELNLIEKGKNYGWPVITYGINYDGTPITEITVKEGMEQPKHYWVPSIATCGVAVVTSDKYPAWKGNILIAALAKQHIARVEMDGTSYVKEEKLLQDIGRVRQVAESPDGYIYAITEATGLLVKLLPIR